MKKIMKCMSGTLVTLLIGILVSMDDARAEDKDVVCVSYETAVQMAQNLADDISGIDGIEARNPRKIYEVNGAAVGYVVDYEVGEIPYGYVVFDSKGENAIREYSFGENIYGPCNKLQNKTTFRSLGSDKIYEVAPFKYGVKNIFGNIENNGKILNYIEKTENDIAEDKNSTTWDEVMFTNDEINARYTRGKTNHIGQFVSFNSDMVEKKYWTLCVCSECASSLCNTL